MKRLWWFALVLMLVSLLSCAKPASRMVNVSEGMSKDDVIKTVGKPNGVEYSDGVEHLYYFMFESPFDEETVEYDVVLVNGSVVSYGRKKY